MMRKCVLNAFYGTVRRTWLPCIASDINIDNVIPGRSNFASCRCGARQLTTID